MGIIIIYNSRVQQIINVYLGCLSSNFTSSSQGTVHLTSEQRDGEVNSHVLQHGKVNLILKWGAGTEQVQLK